MVVLHLYEAVLCLCVALVCVFVLDQDMHTIFQTEIDSMEATTSVCSEFNISVRLRINMKLLDQYWYSCIVKMKGEIN